LFASTWLMRSLPATSRSDGLVGQSSPRRPLYVDIQLANGLNDKKRSPVTSVVDFVRGRNRAASVSGSASVSARASASTDGGISNSPLFSPQRANCRPPLSRMYRPGMRSLDSGLDLSSPTIGHHALLIKEVF
uniref:Kinesin motor domain-containing protein n=1 Tax=Heligmosomoides polygyrus TaxID=6339 RepID=A0A183FIU0_HELPZ